MDDTGLESTNATWSTLRERNPTRFRTRSRHVRLLVRVCRVRVPNIHDECEV